MTVYTKTELTKRTKDSLVRTAKRMGLDVDGLKKDEVIDAILEAQEEDEEEEEEEDGEEEEDEDEESEEEAPVKRFSWL